MRPRKLPHPAKGSEYPPVVLHTPNVDTINNNI